ncbi:MAG: transposase [Dehalococcoidia bacterium]
MTRKALQAAIRDEQRNQKRKRARYPDEVRVAVAELVLAERSRGTTLASLSESLGLPINTLRRWCERREGGSRLAAVEIVAGDRADGPVLVTPSGHRVEGLSLASVLELLEHLG